VIVETARLKYACQDCHEGVIEAPAPPQAVEKSRAAEGLLALVVSTGSKLQTDRRAAL
jgi:transposase